MGAAPSFGGWLKLRRQSLGLTQEALAERVGCAAETLRKLEADARRPSLEIARRLADAVLIPPAEHDAFVQWARTPAGAGRPTTPPTTPLLAPLPSIVPPPARLPMPLTPLIGRALEVAHVCDLLRQPQVRLVTLTGAGGIGKTRLSLQVAAEERSSCRMASFLSRLRRSTILGWSCRRLPRRSVCIRQAVSRCLSTCGRC